MSIAEMNRVTPAHPSSGAIRRPESRISVVIPARNEAATIGSLVASLRAHLVTEHHFIDEIIVMDHASRDATADLAQQAGATVVNADTVLPQFGPARGKGDVLWRSLAVANGEIIVWLDADLRDFDPYSVVRLAGPLLVDSDVHMVRPKYERTLHGVAGEGGRTTELAARPVLALLRPDLAQVKEPLAGEYAIRKSTALTLEFEIDYGVEIGLLMDIHARYGMRAIAEVDLGRRVHRNRPLSELGPQAEQVLRAALRRGEHRSSALGRASRSLARSPLTAVTNSSRSRSA